MPSESNGTRTDAVVALLTRQVALLESIDRTMKELAARRRAAAPVAVATAADLDGKYGDPKLWFKPRDWTGPSYKDRPFSQCPPELLDLAAKSIDWFAEQAAEKDERTRNGKPKADYLRQDAARARGWAQRIRAGHVVQAMSEVAPSRWEPGPDPDDIGFGDDTGMFTTGEAKW